MGLQVPVMDLIADVIMASKVFNFLLFQMGKRFRESKTKISFLNAEFVIKIGVCVVFRSDYHALGGLHQAARGS